MTVIYQIAVDQDRIHNMAIWLYYEMCYGNCPQKYQERCEVDVDDIGQNFGEPNFTDA